MFTSFFTQGEKRLEEIGRLTSATAKLITMFEDPWEELTFRNVGNQGRIFNAVEDRFLLCLTHLHGYVICFWCFFGEYFCAFVESNFLRSVSIIAIVVYLPPTSRFIH